MKMRRRGGVEMWRCVVVCCLGLLVVWCGAEVRRLWSVWRLWRCGSCLEMPSIRCSMRNSLSVSALLIPVCSAEVPITRRGTELWSIRARELESSKNIQASGGTAHKKAGGGWLEGGEGGGGVWVEAACEDERHWVVHVELQHQIPDRVVAAPLLPAAS